MISHKVYSAKRFLWNIALQVMWFNQVCTPVHCTLLSFTTGLFLHFQSSFQKLIFDSSLSADKQLNVYLEKWGVLPGSSLSHNLSQKWWLTQVHYKLSTLWAQHEKFPLIDIVTVNPEVSGLSLSLVKVHFSPFSKLKEMKKLFKMSLATFLLIQLPS